MSPQFTGSDDDAQRHDRSRRRFLLGVGAAAAMAGCLADSNDDDDGNETSADDTTENDTTTDDTTATPEPSGTDDDENGDEGLSPAAARELLPTDAIAFRYEPPLGNPFGEFWVEVIGETDAAAVRAEAASGSTNEVTPQDGNIDGYLGVAVPVDPDGDEVTVFAVDEEGAAGRVTSSQVPTDDLTPEAAEQAVPNDALSFTYEPPGVGDYGSLLIEVTAETDAETLIGQAQEAPGVFTDRVGNIGDETTLGPGTTLEVGVDPDGDEVIVSATVDGATGEVARWQGPE